MLDIITQRVINSSWIEQQEYHRGEVNGAGSWGIILFQVIQGKTILGRRTKAFKGMEAWNSSLYLEIRTVFLLYSTAIICGSGERSGTQFNFTGYHEPKFAFLNWSYPSYCYVRSLKTAPIKTMNNYSSIS